jgi:ATP-dependent Lon protease
MSVEPDTHVNASPNLVERAETQQPSPAGAGSAIEEPPSEAQRQNPRGPAPDGRPDIPAELPLLPMRELVAFPGTIVPLQIEREKSKRVIEHAIGGNKLVGVVTQRSAETQEPGLDDLYRVGTVCMVLRLIRMPDGSMSIIVQGLTRMSVVQIVSSDPFLTARIEVHDDSTERTPEIDALVNNARQAASRVIELSPNIPDEAQVVLNNIDTAGGVADFLAANLPVSTAERQEILETLDLNLRLRKVNTLLAQQVEVLELSNKIQGQVREQMDKQQREYFLQQQLKAIQKELGETDARQAEIDELRDRVEKANLPEDARKEADRELTRMSRIPQASPEYSVAVDYLTWLVDLPWTAQTDDQLDLERARAILDEDHYDLDKIKRRILEFLAVRKLNPSGKGPILCFLGPPGVGKTSLGKSIARALGRKFIRLSLGGIHDEAQLRGHRRTYIGAMPGRIIQEIRRAGSRNPLFMLDEVDKIGQDFRGDPASALLEVLDPAQNNTCVDNYLDVPFDLSNVMFIATANYLDPIPPPLRDRMELITLSGYTTQEKLFIARRYLVPRQLAENGLTDRDVSLTDEAIVRIATAYTREAGVRDLERQIGAVVRGIAAKVAGATGSREPITVGPEQLREYLGVERFAYETARRTSAPGVATGLAFTPTGGEILFIEAARMPGSGRLTLTGQLGEVMKESAQAAFSIVRSRATELGIDADAIKDADLHIHVPAGAIPKDGPSAGVAIVTAIVSLFTGRPCRADVAMTGEISLTGRVMPIGGVKEKVLAAHRAGVTQVILPEENRKDQEDIPPEVLQQLQVAYVDRVEAALEIALEKT